MANPSGKFHNGQRFTKKADDENHEFIVGLVEVVGLTDDEVETLCEDVVEPRDVAVNKIVMSEGSNGKKHFPLLNDEEMSKNFRRNKFR